MAEIIVCSVTPVFSEAIQALPGDWTTDDFRQLLALSTDYWLDAFAPVGEPEVGP